MGVVVVVVLLKPTQFCKIADIPYCTGNLDLAEKGELPVSKRYSNNSQPPATSLPVPVECGVWSVEWRVWSCGMWDELRSSPVSPTTYDSHMVAAYLSGHH